MNKRGYRQSTRAAAADERTERILRTTLELFVERPFDQITLATVAERAQVGLQTLIRRVGTKEGLVRAVNEWVVPRIVLDRGEPVADPAAVAATVARHNERWGEVIMRTVQQEELSPALAANAAAGRAGHREWIAACFAPRLAGLDGDPRAQLTARLAAVTSTELWAVLRRDQGLSTAEARAAVNDLIDATLDVAHRIGATS